MRTDLLQSRKCLHVRFRKEVHAAFRTKLFEYGLSMQEVLEEFARLVASEDPKLLKAIDDYARRKVQEKIDMLKPKSRQTVSELDKDTLYDLINEER